MSSNNIAQTQVSVREDVRAKEAYERVKQELAALPAQKLVQVNVDINYATATAIRIKPGIDALAHELRKQLREYDTGVSQKLERYAYALRHAHSVYQSKCKPHDDLNQTIHQANETRRVLLSDCRSLVSRKLIGAGSLEGYSGLVGYKIIASDLQLLSTALSTNWESIEGRCATTAAEIERARRLAARIVHLVALRERAPALMARAADNRARAFTLFVNCYDEIRRSVSFVRWHEGDLEEFAPSLYAGRRRPAHPSEHDHLEDIEREKEGIQ